MYSIKDFSILEGVLLIAPKAELDSVYDLINRAELGDEVSAHTLYKIAKSNAPAYTAPVAGHVSIGSGNNGVVTVTSAYKWAESNNLTITVAINAGASTALTATKSGNDITVTLGTAGAGVADATKNTATLVAGAINGIVGKTFTAVASGTGASSITAVVAKTNFIGGVDEVLTEERQAWNHAVKAVSDLFA